MNDKSEFKKKTIEDQPPPAKEEPNPWLWLEEHVTVMTQRNHRIQEHERNIGTAVRSVPLRPGARPSGDPVRPRPQMVAGPSHSSSPGRTVSTKSPVNTTCR